MPSESFLKYYAADQEEPRQRRIPDPHVHPEDHKVGMAAVRTERIRGGRGQAWEIRGSGLPGGAGRDLKENKKIARTRPCAGGACAPGGIYVYYTISRTQGQAGKSRFLF